MSLLYNKDCEDIIRIMESTDDYRQKIYEKLQSIRSRSEDLGAASVLVSLYS